MSQGSNVRHFRRNGRSVLRFHQALAVVVLTAVELSLQLPLTVVELHLQLLLQLLPPFTLVVQHQLLALRLHPLPDPLPQRLLRVVCQFVR